MRNFAGRKASNESEEEVLIRKSIVVLLLPVLMVAAAACNTSRNAAVAMNEELMNLSKEEVFERADALFEAKRWVPARTHYSYVYENFPNDPLGRRSLLKVADTYFQQGGAVNLVEAQYKYRDFINRYPGSEQADYAMLQIANISFQQMEPAHNDQTKTREAIQKYQEMISAFPESPLRPEAEARIRDARDRLARHEHQVALFYMQRRSHAAAVTRLNAIVEQYPDYSSRDEAFYDLGRALEMLGRTGEARLYFERVIAEFPDSRFAQLSREQLGSLES